MVVMARILIGEDDTFLSSLLLTGLQKEGHEVESAIDGAQTIEKTQSWHPDLILLDLLMPNVDGYAVLNTLRANKDTMRIPVIILTNLASEGDRARAEKYSITDYLVKANTTPKELSAKIKKLLS